MDDRTAPAGWYPQPDGTQRFWTGVGWSDQVRPPTGPPSPGQAVVRVDPRSAAALSRAQLAYTPAGYVAVSHVAPKSPGLALLGSFFVAGLGQLMNGQVAKGVLMFLAYVVSLVLILAFVGLVLAPAVWVWSMVDAYTGAQRWNAQHGILS